ncbi:carbohydrate ABC transporter permease [Bacillus sp. FJAT-49732]|uniref:Carbohydrate ABC transporter permease n=2 Tax=Lederbergia citrisecunda TaxID=2833583 RepID=A0A942TNI9_9BACI|nr:carbohydrate ABC transporter permease [Lederbergia citrisecunda]
MSIVSIAPFLWMVSTSLKKPNEIFIMPPVWIPSEFDWRNYYEAWNAGGMNFGTMFVNTLLIVLPVTIFTVLVSSLASYAFARINFYGKNFIFILLLASLMIPGTVTLLPQFIVFSKIGWIDSFKPLIIPGLFGNAFAIFLIRQFFLTLPGDLEDAAMIDGCSRFRIWWQIFLPLSKPVLATLTVFTFQGVYNDFMGPLIYINSMNKFTVQLGLASFKGVYSTNYDLLMAASVFTLLPIIIIFLLAQRYFIEGITLTGVK